MKLIVACDPNGGIGYNNKLPWTNIQGDLPRFKRLTEGQTVIMGRNTWDSLPKKPLPKRYNFVVTSQQLDMPEHSECITYEEFTAPSCSLRFSSTWLIGGAQLVNACWPHITEIHLTNVYDHYTCDTHIDLLYVEANFTRVWSEVFPDHRYEIWKRK